MSMTKDQQRIAIAEWMGYVNIHEQSGFYFGNPSTNKTFGDREELPDYPNDLNAIHEAERRLGLNKADLYNQNLYKCVFDGTTEVTPDMLTDAELTFCINTAASQSRSEALCRTLWPERGSK